MSKRCFFIEPTYLKHLMQSLKDETINENIFKSIATTSLTFDAIARATTGRGGERL